MGSVESFRLVRMYNSAGEGCLVSEHEVEAFKKSAGLTTVPPAPVPPKADDPPKEDDDPAPPVTGKKGRQSKGG